MLRTFLTEHGASYSAGSDAAMQMRLLKARGRRRWAIVRPDLLIQHREASRQFDSRQLTWKTFTAGISSASVPSSDLNSIRATYSRLIKLVAGLLGDDTTSDELHMAAHEVYTLAASASVEFLARDRDHAEPISVLSHLSVAIGQVLGTPKVPLESARLARELAGDLLQWRSAHVPGTPPVTGHQQKDDEWSIQDYTTPGSAPPSESSMLDPLLSRLTQPQQEPAVAPTVAATPMPIQREAPTLFSAAEAKEWLRLNAEQYADKAGLMPPELIRTLSASLSSDMSDDALQGELFDMLGDGSFEFVAQLLERRWHIVSAGGAVSLVQSNKASQQRSRPSPQVTVQSETAKMLAKLQRKEEKKARRGNKGESAVLTTTPQLQVDLFAGLLPAGTTTDYAFGRGSALPEGSTRRHTEAYEEVQLPAPVSANVTHANEPLVPTSQFDSYARGAFSGIKTLNRIQSRLFHTAYRSNENILVCAPTGAGKTNVAMMTAVREAELHFRDGVLHRDEFKIVYVAPMKALAGEMVRNFGQRLAPLGITVKEMTGDMQLSRKEVSETQMIITTPEKWDVVTRKSGDMALVSQVRLLIIDEVHLLHDSRGPVIESLVARTLRQVEASQSMIRIVGLSATLPNYQDVAGFLRVNLGSGLYHFDNSYRPVPLSQTFVGVKEPRPAMQRSAMTNVAYEKVTESLRQGNQVMVFVHSRKDTGKTARSLAELAKARGQIGLFAAQSKAGTVKDLSRSRNMELKEIFADGFGIHHAGMLRSDRNLVEKLFREGAINVLCTTATLAWGINLPAHTVIIKGTQVYDSARGTFVDLGILDVMQIFGRAGRPQFDSTGDAVLVTTHDRLSHYLKLMNHQMPIESQFVSHMQDNLNAEVVLGTVSNVREASEWLSYTYLYVRMMRNPLVYGLTHDSVMMDPTLVQHRDDLIKAAARQLDRERMLRFDERSGNLSATDLGRTASHFYIQHGTIEVFNEMLTPRMNNADILYVIAHAQEFEEVKLRDDEMPELERLVGQACPLPIRGGWDNEKGKVNVLLQAYISRVYVEGFSLISDTHYVTQNAGRISRALFEIVLKRGWSKMAETILKFCLMIDRRQWVAQSELRQFEKALPAEVIMKLEEKHATIDKLLDMDAQEIGALVRHQRMGPVVQSLVNSIPSLDMHAKVQPITDSVLRITLTITPAFQWRDRVHGNSEAFWIWVDDAENEIIYHTEYFVLHRRNAAEPQTLTFTIPVFRPMPPQYFVTSLSDRWLGSHAVLPVPFQDLVLPSEYRAHTELLNLLPLPVAALQDEATQAALYPAFTHFNAVQTQCFHTLYHSDDNVLLGAPTGSGKTIAGEIAMLRLFRERPTAKVVYVAPLKALAKERIKDWKGRFGAMGRRVVELTGDVTPDIRALQSADIIVTTPEKWDGISRNWRRRRYVQRVGLVVIDEIHLLGADRGPILEVIVSRMRYISVFTDSHVRIVGLSTALANAGDLASWLGIGPKSGLFNFRPEVRPVPLESHIAGFPGKHYCPRMASMNKPTFSAILEHSPDKPVLVFVSSRRQTRLTAIDLISYCAQAPNPRQFVRLSDADLDAILQTVRDPHLRNALSFGIGMHHAGLHEGDRGVVEELFVRQKIQILVSTSTLAWGVNFPAHLVVVKGTEYYDAKTQRYVDFPITDVLQMIGRAGRPQYDQRGVAVIMVAESKKNYYRKFLYAPFPVESSLADSLHDHILAEIVGGTIGRCQDAIDYLSWTYFYRRIGQNPGYYGVDDTSAAGINTFLSHLVDGVISDLEKADCVTLTEGEAPIGADPMVIEPTTLGRIASFYYLKHKTVKLFSQRMHATDDIAELLSLVCDCEEFAELPVRHNEDKLNAELAAQVKLPVTSHGFESPHVKANLLFQAHFSRLPLPIADYATDTKSVLDNVMRVLQALVDVASDVGWLRTALRAIMLLQMVVQGRWIQDSTLLLLPHVDSRAIKQLARSGISHLPQLAGIDCRAALDKAGLSAKEAESANKVAAQLPLVDVEVECGPLAVEEETQVKVQLKRQGKSKQSVRAYAPKYTKPVDEGWFLVLGDPQSGELFAVKRLPAVSAMCETVLTFVPTVADLSRYVLYVMSDCYLGMDQEVILN